MGGGDRDLEEDGDEEWERQRRRDSRLSLAWHRRALAAVWRAWETPSGSGAAAAADGVSSPSPSLFPLPLDRSPLPPSPSSNAAPAPLGAWPWFYPRGEELRRLRREQEASRAAERARVQQQQQQQRQKQQMLRGVAAGAGGGVPGCHGKGRAATGGGGGPFAPYHRYHHRPSSSSSINQLALLTGFGTGTGKREMMGLSELRKAIRADVLRAHKGVRRRWRAELMARFGAEAKASGEEGEHRRVEKLLPPPSVVVRGGEEEGDGGEGLQQQLQGGLLALFLDGPEDEGKGEEAIPYAPETYMDDDEEDWADGYGGWWGGKGKGKGGKRGKRQRQMMMDPHCFNPRSLLPGARGPAFGSGFGGHGRGGGESSGSSSSELITQLAKADNGRIVFEGRNFSKCAHVVMRLCALHPSMFVCIDICSSSMFVCIDICWEAPHNQPNSIHTHIRKYINISPPKNRYEITSTTRLGGGHFGTIFAVREMQTGRECVVKLYKRYVGVCDCMAVVVVYVKVGSWDVGGKNTCDMHAHAEGQARCPDNTKQTTGNASRYNTCNDSSQRDAALDVAHEKNFLIMARRCQCTCVPTCPRACSMGYAHMKSPQNYNQHYVYPT